MSDTYTPYNPKPGDDPVWDDWLAEHTRRLQNAQADAEFGRAKLNDEYQRGIALLDEGLPGQRSQLEAGLIGRGIGRSSEALRRRGDLETQVANQKLDADRARLEGLSGIDQAYQRNSSDWAAERERQITESRTRLKKRGKTAPKTTAPKPTVKKTTGSTTSTYKPVVTPARPTGLERY